MDAAAKQQIKDALLEQAQTELAAMRQRLDSEHAAAEVDEEDVSRVDDVSQQDYAGDLAGLTEESISHAQEGITAIEALDVSPTSSVRDGAVVTFGGGRYVVGVAAAEFEAGGQTYEGIAPDAPVHEAILGKSAGDTFTIAEREQTLDEVF